MNRLENEGEKASLPNEKQDKEKLLSLLVPLGEKKQM